MLELPRDAHIDERLRREPIIWLGSTRPDGRPHLAPVWFLWDGATILIFSFPNAQRLRNIRANPAVMLALDTADSGRDAVMIEGHAELLDGATITATLPAFVEKYNMLRQMTPEAWAAQFSQPIRITPSRFIAWGGV